MPPTSHTSASGDSADDTGDEGESIGGDGRPAADGGDDALTYGDEAADTGDGDGSRADDGADAGSGDDATAGDDDGGPADGGDHGDAGGDGADGDDDGDTGGDGDDGPVLPSGDGTWLHPYPIDSLPTSVSGDTAMVTTSEADAYSPCAPGTNEGGTEIIYTFIAPADGMLTLVLDDVAGDSIDVDVNLLSAPDPGSCLARANINLSYPITAGTQYWIAVDTWCSTTACRPGPFVLDLEFVPSASGSCPAGMAEQPPFGTRPGFCMDLYEAPNVAGALPLVMYNFNEAAAWCQARGKRLCYDDEWTVTCAGPNNYDYVYSDTLTLGICNDDKVWRQYVQSELNKWPASVCKPAIESLAALLSAARAVSTSAGQAANHVEWLYQGAGSGTHTGCTNVHGVYDLSGNVEEWTRRRSPGTAGYSGNLKGRYWADTRTCSNNITTHADGFRFYEIGFRCCSDLQ